jgi:hypothetical protein
VVRSGRNKASSHSPVDHLFLLPAGYFSPREQANFDQLRETGDPNLHSLSRAPTSRTAMHNTPTPGRHSQGQPALSTALPAVRYSVAAPLHDASYGFFGHWTRQDTHDTAASAGLPRKRTRRKCGASIGWRRGCPVRLVIRWRALLSRCSLPTRLCRVDPVALQSHPAPLWSLPDRPRVVQPQCRRVIDAIWVYGKVDQGISPVPLSILHENHVCPGLLQAAA